MKRPIAMLLAVAAVRAAAAGSVLEVPPAEVLPALAATYDAVTNVVCTVRREAAGAPDAMVSRVSFARGDRLRVETLAPESALTVADGTNVWVRGPGEKAPSRTPLAAYADAQLVFVRAVPATAETNLRALDPATARDLPAEPPYARRVAFRAVLPGRPASDAAPEVLVSFDEAGRVARLDPPGGAPALFFEDPFEPLPGAWFFRRVVAAAGGDRTRPQMVSSFERIRVNEPLPADSFDASMAFP